MKVSAVRSRTMRAVKSRDTGPELLVRRLIFGLGYRYRLHRKDLPGKPDIVFPARRAVIFVHGCFWHGHKCKRGNRLPKTNVNYWKAKIKKNRIRDARHRRTLRSQNWKSLSLWECKLGNQTSLSRNIRNFLGPS